ncbi:MerR family transcriptional regulator [Clostridium sp. Mt-5]|uniref:MerR family transcriptional regulator n=1 Tax=Clostridium moutaii TaxID=3240932 RepID=A0ABV4BT73_9CLOT
MKDFREDFITVGELAKKVGVTVRTLQYYDKIGLLKAGFNEGGHRIYKLDDIIKLQQILFLKSLGFSLKQIKNKILKQRTSLGFEQIFTNQRKILIGQITNLNKIVNMLNEVIDEIKIGKEISFEKLMFIMEQMNQGNPYTFVIRYFGDEQLKNLARRFYSPEKYREYMEEYKDIFTRLNDLYRKGADPLGSEGQKLAKDWWKMVNQFTAGDTNLLKSLLYAGRDIKNWPENTTNLKDAIEHFLINALYVYFRKNNIQFSEMEVGKDG